MDAPDAQAEWQPAFPTDIALTLGRLQHGRGDPVQRTQPGIGVWRTARTPEGPASLLIAPGPGGAIRATAWGSGAANTVRGAPRMLGSDDDPTTFEPRHPLLVEAHRRFPGLRIARSGDVFEAVVGAVLEQRVEGAEALAAWGRLIEQAGTPAPGPAPDGMRVFPDGRAFLALPSWVWRRAGVDSRRAEAVRAAAQVEASLQRLADRPVAVADAALRSIRGIGAWTSAEVRQRALGDADALSVGDFHLAKIVGWALADGPFTDAELVPFLEPWRPHRYRVARLLYALGIETLPRHAPRRPRG